MEPKSATSVTPELMFAQRDPGSVCSREFHFFVVHDAPVVTIVLIMRADAVFGAWRG
jgi:hypothetical protein